MNKTTEELSKLDELCMKADIELAHRFGNHSLSDKQLKKEWVKELEKLIRADERKECVAACIEQYDQSMLASSSAKKVKDQELYANTALGAKFAAVRIMNRGSA